MGHGLAVHHLNRNPSPNGVSHGGVAVVLRNSVTSSSLFMFPNPECFEILPIAVDLVGVERKLFIIAAYVPPNYSMIKARACLQHVANIVLDMKRTSNNPYVIVTGDFNQWDVAGALADFPDLQELETPPTRDDRRIDRTFCNWTDEIQDFGCLPPLETEGTAASRTYSDHKIQYACSRIPKKQPTLWESYTYRPFNERGAVAFIAELSEVDWEPLYALPTADDMAVKLQHVLDGLMEKHFPEKVVKRKESDLPWFNGTARKMVRKKQAIYKSEGKSRRWEEQAVKVEAYLERGRQNFLRNQRDKLLGPDASKNFFKNVKAFRTSEKPKTFNLRDLRPGKSEAEVATEAAAFFNRISSEFSPLEPRDIPSTYHRDLPLLSPAAVQVMLNKAKKTGSMVQGDIFPKLINRCSGVLAWPLSAIFNCILATYRWPIHWKKEYVTIIPKKSTPKELSDLRNISCTLFFSKVFEQYVLECLQEEFTLKDNQYGGVKGCSTTHMIVDILQEICENAEDYRSATVLCAIDYSKAFNRMSFQHCLDALRQKGASTPVIRLVATFLSNRTMTVRVGNSWSDPLPVNGGCPQGSILGISLFNTTTESLEDDFVLFESRRLGQFNDRTAPNMSPIHQQQAVTAAACSTPAGPSVDMDPMLSPINVIPGPTETYQPKVLLTHVPQPVLIVPPEEEKVGTQVLTVKAVKIFKYVDDNISVDKVNFGQTQTVEINGEKLKIKQALNLQNAFRSITCKAREKGMVVNNSKTKLLTVSDALNYRPRAFILDSEGNKIDTMNILGFHLSDRPNVNAHVQHVVKKMRQRYWTLYHLRRVGFTEGELVKVYKSMLVPIADYCCPAYHSMLNDIQDQELERSQVGALRAIFGYGDTATELRHIAGVETLRERRIRLTDDFARKCLESDRFKKWFPENENRGGRRKERFKEFPAKTDRLKDSPLYYMRRRLNDKEGKKYGERNRKYRENFALDMPR